jgi:hypothetical protein
MNAWIGDGERDGVAANPVPRVAFIEIPVSTFFFFAPLEVGRVIPFLRDKTCM